MCRYAFKTYKSHFVCFGCRKTFKKPPIEDLAKQNGEWEEYKKAMWNLNSGKTQKFRNENSELVKYLESKYLNRKEKCPECSQTMFDIGLDFKAPKKDKLREWKIIESMTNTGITFHTCGCYGIGYVPKKRDDYIKYLLGKKKYYKERIKKRDAKLNSENLNEYLERFTELINLIEKEISKL